MGFLFALLVILIIVGTFMDLMYRFEKAPKPESKYVRIIHWCLVALFYITIIFS
jgi:Na+-transporting methylmalonyl-CoA/oxaloacetate decarboxylase gamma subunit